MFYSITGKVILTEPGTVVIETGGIGYRLTVSGKTLGYAAENAGTENVSLFTYLSVREDAIEPVSYTHLYCASTCPIADFQNME